ncbi:MAG: DUF1611 domain-containing protein [Leptolyngbyaceae cyanobacterium]
MSMIYPEHRLAILLHDGIKNATGKTGLAMLRYTSAQVVCVVDRQSAGRSLLELTSINRSVPIVASVEAALSYKPDVLAIGIAPSGGKLPEAWRGEIEKAIKAGLSIANGLHTPLAEDPELQALLQPEQWVWDVRREPTGLTVGSGAARTLSCLRVLTVGTDMGVGKMSTSLELHRAALNRGLRSCFLATGQAGIMISGSGVPLDAVRVDFASGAVEQMVMAAGQNADILQIEGQGSLLNPASTATLPLMRGSQPTHLILVHRAGQQSIRNFPGFTIPPLRQVVTLYEVLAEACGVFAATRVAAIALNTAHLTEHAAEAAIEQVNIETGLPCTDPVRFGAEVLLNSILGIKHY